MTKRLMWIDWMKVIGMYCIVWGHFFSIGHKYLYIFNVPLFFIISGFLSKKESNYRVFWNKILNNFFIPLFIISSINFCIHVITAYFHGTLSLHEIYSFPFLVLIGQWYQLGGMWFVYTLIVLKILLQFFPNKLTCFFNFILLMLLLYYLKIHNGFILGIDFSVHPNSILNICTAYPFFIIGYLLKKYSDRLNNYKIFNIFVWGGEEIILFLVICLCGHYNSFVWMYKNQFGNNFLLFLIGGIAGTGLIYLLAKALNEKFSFYVQVLARGMILILGFQMIFIKIFMRLYPNRTFLDAVFSFLIMLIFIPIILFVEKKFPILLGNRSKYKKLTDSKI